jgi:ABC-type polysaccharide/polyol phosphate export permease
MTKRNTTIAQSSKASLAGRFGGAVKKIMGFVWMLLAPIVIFFLINGAFQNIGNGTKDINKPIPWIIIITIFIPIAIGLMIFGYYAVKGEYDKE